MWLHHLEKASRPSPGAGWSQAQPWRRLGCRGWWGCRSSRGSSSASWSCTWCRDRAPDSTRRSPRSVWPAPLQIISQLKLEVPDGSRCWNTLLSKVEKLVERWNGRRSKLGRQRCRSTHLVAAKHLERRVAESRRSMHPSQSFWITLPPDHPASPYFCPRALSATFDSVRLSALWWQLATLGRGCHHATFFLGH